jgi:predicted Zn finger-like uncharacterized protein
MTIRCPQCATIVPLADDVGAEGTMVRCAACGTRWLARTFAGDPYGRQLQRMERADIEDALVIEHVGPGFERAAPRKSLPVAVAAAKPAGRKWWRIGAAAVAVLIGLIALRSPIVAAFAGGLPAEVTGLEFTSIHSETLHRKGTSTLVVEGQIVNRSANDVALPAIRITLRSPAGDPVSSWLVEPAVAGLAPGRSIGFRSALASPPPDAAQVTLDLAARKGI